MKKTFIIIGAILLLLAAAYYYFFPGRNFLEVAGIKKPAPIPEVGAVDAVRENLSNKTADNGSFVKQAAVVKNTNGFPLIQGQSGSIFAPDIMVKDIQQSLNERYGTKLAVDGIFGPKTAKALNIYGFADVIYGDDYDEILGI